MPSAPSTASQAGSRTMSKSGWADRHWRDRPRRSRRCTSTPRWSSLRRFSRRELVMCRPSESLSMAGAPPRRTVRTEDVGCHAGPQAPRSLTSPASRRAATSGRCSTARNCQGCRGRRAYPSGAAGPSAARRAVSAGAVTGRPRSVQAESVPSTEGATASQCSGKEPRSSGEYRRASSSVRPSLLFGVGCSGCPRSRACSAARKRSGPPRSPEPARSRRKTAVRRTESATRATRSGPSGPGAPAVSRTSSAASVTGSTGGADAGEPESRGGRSGALRSGTSSGRARRTPYRRPAAARGGRRRRGRTRRPHGPSSGSGSPCPRPGRRRRDRGRPGGRPRTGGCAARAAARAGRRAPGQAVVRCPESRRTPRRRRARRPEPQQAPEQRGSRGRRCPRGPVRGPRGPVRGRGRCATRVLLACRVRGVDLISGRASRVTGRSRRGGRGPPPVRRR